MKKMVLLSFGVVFTALSMVSCKKNNSNPSPSGTTMTLYDSLGGTAMVSDPAQPSVMIEKGRLGIRSVVDSAIFVIAADTAINSYFTVLLSEVTHGNTSGFEALSKNLTDFFCVATGAKDFTYTGKSMTDAHNPATNPRISMKVDNSDFDQFLTDVGTGATKCGVPAALIARLAAVANTVRSQVVQR